MSERDPRVDPRPGDVLRLCGHGVYRVIESTNQRVVDTPEDRASLDYGLHQTNPLHQWRKWACGAEVITRAEDAALAAVLRPVVEGDHQQQA